MKSLILAMMLAQASGEGEGPATCLPGTVMPLAPMEMLLLLRYGEYLTEVDVTEAGDAIRLYSQGVEGGSWTIVGQDRITKLACMLKVG